MIAYIYLFFFRTYSETISIEELRLLNFSPLSTNPTTWSNTLKRLKRLKLAFNRLRTQVRTFKPKTLYKIKHIQIERKFRRTYKKRVNCFKIPSSNGDTQVPIVF